MDVIEQLKGKLIVSCQALENEPLHGSEMMARMALAAKMGGAGGIRSNGVEDINKIKKVTGLPVIGLIKKEYPDSEVYITPTIDEVMLLTKTKADIIALDVTKRSRPNGEKIIQLITFIRNNSNALIMADISTFEEGIEAIELGVDFVSTTLSGYTNKTIKNNKPNFSLVASLAALQKVPVVAEGHISTPAEARKAIEAGAYAVVVGTAITRPQVITERFVSGLIDTSEKV